MSPFSFSQHYRKSSTRPVAERTFFDNQPPRFQDGEMSYGDDVVCFLPGVFLSASNMYVSGTP
jgi:hypothetical protein